MAAVDADGSSRDAVASVRRLAAVLEAVGRQPDCSPEAATALRYFFSGPVVIAEQTMQVAGVAASPDLSGLDERFAPVLDQPAFRALLDLSWRAVRARRVTVVGLRELRAVSRSVGQAEWVLAMLCEPVTTGGSLWGSVADAAAAEARVAPAVATAERLGGVGQFGTRALRSIAVHEGARVHGVLLGPDGCFWMLEAGTGGQAVYGTLVTGRNHELLR